MSSHGAFRASCRDSRSGASAPSRRVRTVSAMSSGASKSRTCAPTSTQRTHPVAMGAWKALSRISTSSTRSCKRTKSGAVCTTSSRPSPRASHAVCTCSKPACQASGSMPSGTGPDHDRRELRADLANSNRRSRADNSSAEVKALQSTNPCARVRPAARLSRASSINWVEPSC